jgi:hypothetical protein
MLIIETGQAAPDAQSYVSAADCLAYHAARGNTAFAALSADQQSAAIIKAMDYLSAEYRTKWKGRRTSLTQALDWPRYDVRLCDGFDAYVPSNSVPAEVVRAVCELAVRAGGSDLMPDIERQVIEETIGPITTKYAPGSPQYVQFRQVDMILRPLMGSSSGIRLVRG